MTGMNKYSDKQKRAMRRRNHIARDLRTRKYRQRVIKNKRLEDSVTWTELEGLDYDRE